jgi:hypothetical protein
MPQAVDNITSVVAQLSERLRDLEHRVAALEKPALATRPVMLSAASASRREALVESKDSYVEGCSQTQPTQRPPAIWGGFPPLEAPAGAFPILGKAIVGFAGAFLLRAIAESGSAPKLPILFVAIVYACCWMVWATRTANRFAAATYAITSTLILSPLLWESTVRFQVLSPIFAAVILAAFFALTLTLSAGHELQLIPWIATLSTVSTALALIVETHELVPLTAALLAVALLTEVGACLRHDLTFRALPAITADFAVWLLVYILASDSVPEGYSPAASSTIAVLCAALLTIYGASIAVRSFLQRNPLTVFEMAQAALAFALTTFGILRATHSSAPAALGGLFLLLSAFCYWGTLSRFAIEPHTRNRRVTATWAAALLLAGTFLLVPANLQIPFLCAAALLAASLYKRTAKLSLGLHASFYIAAAAAAAPLATYVASALAGVVPAAPDWRSWAVTLTAALCYSVESRGSAPNEGRRRLLWIVPASVVAFTIAAWTVTAIVRLAAGHLELSAPRVSVIRTIVLCALALALGFASRPRHIELGWLAYAAVAIGTLKLVFEDLRFGNPASLVVSFLFYGLILILLPRLTRSQASEKS